MSEITYEEACKLYLPKWSQMIISGKSVSVEQAKDIIGKTDIFISNFTIYYSGNENSWNQKALIKMHIEPIIKFYQSTFDDWDFYDVYDEHVKNAKKQLGLIETEFVTNDLIHSYFSFANGWCLPDGTIEYFHNIGKYPSVERVFKDFEKLAVAFPYLDMIATLMDDEEDADDIHPVITFIIKNGKVTVSLNHYELNENLYRGYSNHNNKFDRTPISDEWIDEIGLKFEPILKPIAESLDQAHKKYFKM